MAPKYDRLRVLHEAIEAAGAELGDPIDRIEVSGGTIVVSAGAECARLSFGYSNAYDPQGIPMPGSGSWSVQIQAVTGSSPIVKPLRGFIARLLGRKARQRH